jgi:phospholipid/cholesterol/gamma-HCH transport system substrate-binding protein
MNNKANYTLIGFFVIVSFFAMSIFGYWLLKPSNELETKKYVIYFDESVLGLNVNSPVKYRGIDVGKVQKIQINPKNTEQVKVLISVLKTTPIKTTTKAKLTSQGITGLSYINLSLGDKDSPLLTAKKGEKYPVIQSEPSFFERFQQNIGHLSSEVSSTLSNIDKLLKDENQKEITMILKQSKIFMTKLNKTLSDETILDFQQSVKNLKNSSKELQKLIPHIDNLTKNSISWEKNISASLKSIAQSYISIQKSMDDIGNSFKRGDFDIKSITADTIPMLNKSISSLNQLLIELKETLKVYKSNPRELLFKEKEQNKAPGE